LIICFMRLPCIFPLRYGLKATTHILAVLGLVLCFAAISLLLSPSQSCAQAMPSWLGGGRIWDWSDFRGNVGFRVYMPRLIAGTAKFGTTEFDMLGAGNFSFQPQPDFFKEGWFVLYIDRLSLRAHFEEDHRFRGLVGTASVNLSQLPVIRRWWRGDANTPLDSWGTRPDDIRVDDPQRMSEVDLGWTRFGLDLDIIRYPFIRAGINFDRHFESVIFLNRQDLTSVLVRAQQNYNPFINTPLEWRYSQLITGDRVHKLTTRQPPVTLGVHAFASPGRVFGIPVTGQARARFPFPFLAKIVGDPAETRITEWEVSIGLRPNIWNTSLYGYSTFSLGIDAGFKSTYLDMDSGDGLWNVKAHWQGPYVQVGLYF